MLLSLACTIGFTACDSDNDLRVPLSQPAVTQGNGNYQSLSFSWEKVDNAVQYGYRLVDPNGRAVKSDVTQKTSVYISGLQPSTTYTLQVWAFAGMDSDFSTPPAITLTSTTADLEKLATPAVTASSENGVTFRWDAVPNALEYSYTVTDSDGALVISGTTVEIYMQLSGYPDGEYTISVTALGHDGYSQSDAGTTTGIILVYEIYRVKGTYHSAALDSSWTATMVAYSDNSFSILSFYGVEGYNLDFAVNTSSSADKFSFRNGEYVYDADAGYKTWQVPTGLSNPSMLIAYPWDNWCYFEGDAKSGSVNIGCYYGANYANWDYDAFTWNDMMSVITGTFKNHFVGGTSLFSNDWTWEEIDVDNWTATIKKVDDEYVEIDGIFLTDNPVYGLVDFEVGTITIEPQEDYYTYYTFASANGPTESVVATINTDGSITIPNFGVWYYFEGDAWYYYARGTSTLTK